MLQISNDHAVVPAVTNPNREQTQIIIPIPCSDSSSFQIKENVIVSASLLQLTLNDQFSQAHKPWTSFKV